MIRYGETALGYCVLLVVADGVGGLQGGEIASRSVVEKLNDWWNITLKNIEFITTKNVNCLINESLSASIADINFEMYEKSNNGGNKMGTTLSLLFIMDNWYFIKHAGDSRIYKFSNNLQQLTEDDTLLNQYLKSGAESEPVGGYDALANTLTKCIGVKPSVELSEQFGKLDENDSFILCTDGLYKHIGINEIYKCIYKCCKNSKKSLELLQQLVYKARNRGESDDISSITLISIKDSISLLKKFIKL